MPKHRDATTECLNKNVLNVSKYSKRAAVKKDDYGALNYTVQLPPHLTCNHCVFQVSQNLTGIFKTQFYSYFLFNFSGNIMQVIAGGQIQLLSNNVLDVATRKSFMVAVSNLIET